MPLQKLVAKVEIEGDACPECGQKLQVVSGRRCCRNSSGHADGLPLVEKRQARISDRATP